MIVYTGYWEDRFMVSPSEDDEALFKALGRLSLTYDDRVLVMQPSPDGNLSVTQSRSRNGGRGRRYQWRIGQRPWARWMCHPVELAIGDDDAMTLELPDDHELPWPRIMSLGGSADLRVIAHREFWVRAGSAFEAGGRDVLKRMLQEVPDNFRQHLSGDTWDVVVSEVTNGRTRPTEEELRS